jgi:fibronectin type 3 domain-containing protein
VPGSPTGLVATPGNAQVALAWTPPASNGGSSITGYRIYRGTTPGAASLVATIGLVTTYTDVALTNGTTYYYQVAASNAAGVGARSTEVSAKPATVPGPPRNVTATRNSVKGVTLTWTAPLSDGGSAVTGYRIYRSTTSNGQTFLLAVGNVSQYVDTATTSGVRYYYKLTAVNAIGEGLLSSQTSAIAR